MRPICKPVYAAREAVDVSPEGASVRPAKGEALVQRPHQTLFLFPATSGPTGQKFIFNPTRTPFVNSGANSWPVGPNTARHRI